MVNDGKYTIHGSNDQAPCTVSNLQPPTKMEGPQHRSLIPTWESQQTNGGVFG